MRNLKSSALLPVAALALVIGIAASVSSRHVDKTGDKNFAKLTTKAVGERNQRCASKRTYDAVQQELFRQAAEMRGSDEAAFGEISNYSIVRMEQPIVRSFDKELGTVRCSGKVILQLTRGTSVVGGRHALDAEIDYVLQPAAEGSGDVVMLEGEAPVTVPLATLARTGRQPELRARQATIATQDVVVASGPAIREPVARPASPSPPPFAKARMGPAVPAVINTEPNVVRASAGSVRPSFNCRYARTRGEVSVCRDADLASLDRRMASDYYHAVASANASQREALRSTRNSFLRKRDRCSTDACMSASYQERMGEIGTIMTPR